MDKTRSNQFIYTHTRFTYLRLRTSSFDSQVIGMRFRFGFQFCVILVQLVAISNTDYKRDSCKQDNDRQLCQVCKIKTIIDIYIHQVYNVYIYIYIHIYIYIYIYIHIYYIHYVLYI